jgi:hypothetical protein
MGSFSDRLLEGRLEEREREEDLKRERERKT